MEIPRILPPIEADDGQEFNAWLTQCRAISTAASDQLSLTAAYVYARLRRYALAQGLSGHQASRAARSVALPLAQAADAFEDFAVALRLADGRPDVTAPAEPGRPADLDPAELTAAAADLLAATIARAAGVDADDYDPGGIYFDPTGDDPDAAVYLDWSTRMPTGERGLEISDGYHDPIIVDVAPAPLRELRNELGRTLGLIDGEPQSVVVLGEGGDAAYIDWSVVNADGTVCFEVGDPAGEVAAVQLDLTRDDLAQIHARLTAQIAADDADPPPATPTTEPDQPVLDPPPALSAAAGGPS